MLLSNFFIADFLLRTASISINILAICISSISMKLHAAASSGIFVPILLCYSLNISAQHTDSNSAQVSRPLRVQSLHTRKNYLSARSVIIPGALISYGFASLKSGVLQKINKNVGEEVVEDASGFNTRVDNYLRYAPAASVYLLSAAGIKARHKIVDRTIILSMSSVLSAQLVTALKHGTHQMRPVGSTYNSFP